MCGVLVDNAPTDVQLSTNMYVPGSAAGSVVAVFAVTDDIATTYTYTIVSQSVANGFAVVTMGATSQLVIGSGAPTGSVTVSIRVTDVSHASLQIEKQFVVSERCVVLLFFCFCSFCAAMHASRVLTMLLSFLCYTSQSLLACDRLICRRRRRH